MPASKIKVAILGGGCGAVSAAYWLSATQHLRDTYAVTVYTQGWRLGGKGASGRNAAQGERIEEHGLHMMMGFYENAFHTIQGAYAAMPPDAGAAFPDWRKAFEPRRRITLMMPWTNAPSGWRAWNLDFPRFPGTPGDGPLALAPGTDYMHETLHYVTSLLVRDTLQGVLDRLRAHSSWLGVIAHLAERLLDDLTEHLAARADYTIEAHRTTLCATLRVLQSWVRDHLLERIADTAAGIVDDLRFELYCAALLLDLGLAGVIGFLIDVLPYGEAGYARINDADFKDWLQAHGAAESSVHAAPIMGLYDLAFAYVNGDSSDPRNGRVAAGAMLRLTLRMAFTYKDAPLWRMRAGMGDVIFTPLYKTLRARGVTFEFFQRVAALRPAADGLAIDGIALTRQALPIAGYDPLTRVTFADGKHWDCWPSRPLWGQLQGGEQPGVDFEDPWCTVQAGTRTLQRGVDFDCVIAGLPPAALAPVTAPLMGNARWAAMIGNATSVATRSVQLWMKPDLAGLGWPYGATVSVAYADPLRSWGEMSQVLDAEAWPAGAEPRSCEYLCGTFQPTAPPPPAGANDPAYLPAQHAAVKSEAQTWLDHNTRALWPAVTGANGLDRTQLTSAYYRANVAWSELYVQTLPGSVRFRLAPGASGFGNLYLAGDWTLTSINGGCAEAAFESGLHAACAISGEPPPA